MLSGSHARRGHSGFSDSVPGVSDKNLLGTWALGYDGVELMTLNPGKLDWREVKETAEENNLSVVLVCTGEIFGQLGLSYTHPHRSLRREAVERTKEIIDFAGYLGANVNIGGYAGSTAGNWTGRKPLDWLRTRLLSWLTMQPLKMWTLPWRQ